MSKWKPILVLVDDDYDPLEVNPESGPTALNDVIASLDFHDVMALVTEVEYTPTEAKDLCQKTIDWLVSAPWNDKGSIAVLPALTLLGSLRKALEGLPSDPAREAAPDLLAVLKQIVADYAEAEDDVTFCDERLTANIEDAKRAIAKAGGNP